MPSILTVTQLCDYLTALVREDALLADVTVVGEVSNATLAKSGHFYFTLRDADAALSCVMWKSALRAVYQTPGEGQRVVIHGRADFYGPRGQLQLMVDALAPEGGVGDLYRQFEETKARLQAEGLFDPERKRPLPTLPRRIGLITSATGAALRDILRVLSQRWPLADVLLVPSLVQGDQAIASLQASLYTLYDRHDIDVIILARGGGSMEDLWAFNDEDLARLIARSPVPVVVGVGHETDFTIADFVADLRAATPTAAAAAVVPDIAAIRQSLTAAAARLGEWMTTRIERERSEVAFSAAALRRLSPLYRIDRQRLLLDDLDRRLTRAAQERLQRQRLVLTGLEQRLTALNPSAVLTRGYAIVQDDAGHIIQSVQQTTPTQPLTVRVSDGSFGVRVSSDK